MDRVSGTRASCGRSCRPLWVSWCSPCSPLSTDWTKVNEWRHHGLRWVTFGVVGSLLICQTVFLIVDDGPVPSSTSSPYKPTAAVIALQRYVGSSLVGLVIKFPRKLGRLGLGSSARHQYRLRDSRVRRVRPDRPPLLFQSLGPLQWHGLRGTRRLRLHPRDSTTPRLPGAMASRMYSPVPACLAPREAPS